VFQQYSEYAEQLKKEGYTLVGAYHHEDKETPYATLYKWKAPNSQANLIIEVCYFQWCRGEILSIYQEIIV
jgi:hypothetical protein